MATFIARNDNDFVKQLQTFTSNIQKYTNTFALVPNDVANIVADFNAFSNAMNFYSEAQAFAHNYTVFKNLLRKGGDGVISQFPTAPVIGNFPPLPAANIEARFRSLVQRIANHPAYNAGIGEELGIEAPSETHTPPINAKPTFVVEPSPGGYPNLKWKKGKFQGVEIWKDSGAGFVKLDRDMFPDYIDKSPLPVGTSALWKYKMIYLINDEFASGWSDIVTVTVHGEI